MAVSLNLGGLYDGADSIGCAFDPLCRRRKNDKVDNRQFVINQSNSTTTTALAVFFFLLLIASIIYYSQNGKQ